MLNGDTGHWPADVLYFAFPGLVDPSNGTDYATLARIGNQAIVDRLGGISTW